MAARHHLPQPTDDERRIGLEHLRRLGFSKLPPETLIDGCDIGGEDVPGDVTPGDQRS